MATSTRSPDLRFTYAKRGMMWLIRRLWNLRTEATPRGNRFAILVAGSAIVGALATLLGLVKTFGAVGGESVAPSQRAHILAEDVSGATNYLLLGLALWVPGVLVALVIARRSNGNGGS